MQRRTADTVVGAAIALVLIAGLIATWQSWQTYQRTTSGMMDGMMTTSMMNTGPAPTWILFGTVAVAAVVGVVYLVARESITTGAHATGGQPRTEGLDHTRTTATAEENGAESTESNGRPEILDVLPDDERRILEPVVESPGLTQIELRDRADFSKSKVSQTVSDLEKRGLLSREKQGRTYRVYPASELDEET